MIGTINIELNAANPHLPLKALTAHVGSPSQVRLINVPRAVGKWAINSVAVSVAYPDNSIKSVSATRVGGIWTATIPSCNLSGIKTNGFQVSAGGTDESGSAVAGYVLGVGDVVVISRDGSITVGETTYYAHILDAVPTTPHKGDMAVVGGVWKLYDGTQWVALGGASSVSWDSVTGKPTAFPPSAHTHAQSDINGLADALGGKLDTTGGSLSGSVTITGSDLGETMEIDGAQFKLNNGSGFNFTEDDNAKQSPLYPDNTPVVTQGTGDVRYLGINANAAGLTQSGVTSLFASAVSSTASTTLKDRDCSVVAFSSGMTLTFTASTGLRQFEILITGCTASGSINFPGCTYRGASDALTLEAGDNHLVFAEYASGCFFVTRAVANTITVE